MGFRKNVYTGYDKWKIAVLFGSIFVIFASPVFQDIINNVIQILQQGRLTPFGLLLLGVFVVVIVRIIIN